MTEKTWENLEVGDILIDEVDREVSVLAIVGRIIFISEPDNFDESNCYYTSKELVEMGYKIKGASEDKPSLDSVIDKLNSVNGYASRDDERLAKCCKSKIIKS